MKALEARVKGERFLLAKVTAVVFQGQFHSLIQHTIKTKFQTLTMLAANCDQILQPTPFHPNPELH